MSNIIWRLIVVYIIGTIYNCSIVGAISFNLETTLQNLVLGLILCVGTWLCGEAAKRILGIDKYEDSNNGY